MLLLLRLSYPGSKQGQVSIENNIDKIFEYLRIMSNRKATSAVIPPVALRGIITEDRGSYAVPILG